MTADRVALRGIRCHGHHGVGDAERREGQTFLVDAVLTLDTTAAASSDELADTVDYATLAERLAGLVEGEPVRLLETLAHRLADACLAEPAVSVVEVTVHKPQAPLGLEVVDVSVTVVRP